MADMVSSRYDHSAGRVLPGVCTLYAGLYGVTCRIHHLPLLCRERCHLLNEPNGQSAGTARECDITVRTLRRALALMQDDAERR